MLEYKLYGDETNFHIYSLGEPCLHPQINEILRLLSKYKITTTISTNASIVPHFEKDALESVDRFLISMPGFSQESYDRIHGFDFNKIKNNVIRLRKEVAKLSCGRIPFDMSYHIYQFNESEMVPAKEFCDKYDIRFAPNYAIMIDKDKCLAYASGEMDYAELKDISKDIFLGVLDQQMKDAPRNYCDFQHSFLSVTIDGDIRICGAFRQAVQSKILIGNILTDNIDEIIWKKFHHPRCETCIKAGLTLSKGYECKVYPNGYYEIMKENEFLKEYQDDKKMSDKLQLMKLARQFEQEQYAETLKEQILKCIEENGLEGDAESIISSYTRFGRKTYSKVID